jgi:hypothetical protein
MIRTSGILGAALIVTLLGSTQAQAQSGISGKYCEKFTHLTEAIKAPDGSCPEPAFIRKSDGLCVQKATAEDYLQLNEKEDGSLGFAFSLWYPPYAHYCAIIGTAQKSKEGWTYQENMSNSSDLNRCILNFKDEDGMIKISNDVDARCKTMCGFHTDLGFLNVPKSLKKSDTPDQQAFNYSHYMELPENGGPTCDEDAKSYPEETEIEKHIPVTE